MVRIEHHVPLFHVLDRGLLRLECAHRVVVVEVAVDAHRAELRVEAAQVRVAHLVGHGWPKICRRPRRTCTRWARARACPLWPRRRTPGSRPGQLTAFERVAAAKQDIQRCRQRTYRAALFGGRVDGLAQAHCDVGVLVAFVAKSLSLVSVLLASSPTRTRARW
jgi:hypothetical protein